MVFWSNLILGVVICGILYFTAPFLAYFFKSAESGLVLRVMSCQIVIMSLATVQQALFEREFGFKKLFWIKVVTALIPGFVSMPLAFFGYGVWALVTGSLLGSFFELILLWVNSPWRPKFRYQMVIAKKIFGFGIWVTGESLAVWFLLWGDSLFVGKYLGVDDLGIYRIGSSASLIIFGVLINPVAPVLYSAFSRLQDNTEGLRATFTKVNRVIISLALPLGVVLLIAGQDLSEVIFDERWKGVGFVFSIIGFMQGISWLVGINPELYRAMGRPDINPNNDPVTSAHTP